VKKDQIEKSLAKLGEVMTHFGSNTTWNGYETGLTEDEHIAFNELIENMKHYNGWYSEDMVRKSLLQHGSVLTQENLRDWMSHYEYNSAPKTIAIIMAGNIPLVGFHDFICVLCSGNRVLAKMSSDDNKLLPALAKFMFALNPLLEERVQFSEGKISDFDAVIATGSDSSSVYFEQYFSSYPHIFRKNRTSIAVLTGKESNDELEKLGMDIFDYYGRGCRNVSHLLLPKGYRIDSFFEGIIKMGDVINNKKYGNNYDYNKAVHLMNQEKLLDNNFVLLKESKELFSPLSMIHYHFYDSNEEVESYITENRQKIQCVVGHRGIPFGQTQCPKLNDYADDVDTMTWLNQLS